MLPDVAYVRSGDVHIAYQVLGEGPDLVFTPAGWNHLLLLWELPANARLFRRLASFSRLILWDKRGTGMSDRHGHVPTIDAQMDDLSAVLDAVGSKRAVLFGVADGAMLTATYAATHPDRATAVILYGVTVRFRPGSDGLGVSRAFLRAVQDGASPQQMLELIAPSIAADPFVRDWWNRYAPSSASPGTVGELLACWMEVDLSTVLPALRVPTTVIQRSSDLVTPPPNGRSVADLIAGARYIELPGDFATYTGDVDQLAGEIEEVVTGTRDGADPDRVLATIVFTDIVDSTGHASRLGDATWRGRLDEYETFVTRQLPRFGGRLVKFTGDGMLATFDSPGRGLRCAAEIAQGMQARGLPVRAGVHTGECERRGEDIGGIAVHIAARVGALAQGGEVLLTSTVRDLVVGSQLGFTDRGEQELRGVSGAWRLLALE